MYFCTVSYFECCLCIWLDGAPFELQREHILSGFHLLNWRESMFSVLVMSGGLMLPQYLPTRPPSKHSESIQNNQSNQNIST